MKLWEVVVAGSEPVPLLLAAVVVAFVVADQTVRSVQRRSKRSCHQPEPRLEGQKPQNHEKEEQGREAKPTIQHAQKRTTIESMQ